MPRAVTVRAKAALVFVETRSRRCPDPLQDNALDQDCLRWCQEPLPSAWRAVLFLAVPFAGQSPAPALPVAIPIGALGVERFPAVALAFVSACCASKRFTCKRLACE